MGFLDRFAKKPREWHYAKMMSGYSPVFTQFGSDVYASDIVQQCVSAISDEMRKLQPQHIRRNGNDVIPVDGPVQRALERPNPLMTTADFLEKVSWLLMLNYNAFVLPEFDAASGHRRLAALWPLKPAQVDFIEDPMGRLYAAMRFENGFEATIPYDGLIHVRKRYSVNDYLGGNAAGQPDNGPLLKTLETFDTLMQGVAKGLKASYSINGVVKYNTMLDDGKMKEDIARLEEMLRNSESGFLPMDVKGEFIPFKRDAKLVDKDTLTFLDSQILRHFGVSLPILSGDFTTDQLAAFYQHALEPAIVSLGQAFTKGVFSADERSRGNEIRFYPEELIFMSTQQKLEMVAQLGPSGAIYENEKRTAFGLRPLPELSGVRMMSLNWVPVEYARDYQLNGGDAGKGEGDGEAQ